MFQSTEATEMGHLRDLHEVIKQAKLVLVSSDPTIHSSRNYEKIYYQVLETAPSPRMDLWSSST